MLKAPSVRIPNVSVSERLNCFRDAVLKTILNGGSAKKVEISLDEFPGGVECARSRFTDESGRRIIRFAKPMSVQLLVQIAHRQAKSA